LSDPLNTKDAVLYGQFVQAAYEMFKHPVGPDPLRPEPALIPAGYELGAWIQMSDFALDLSVPKFYGIVAHSLENPDSRVIAIRGTEGAIEWIDDAAAIPVPFRQVPSAGRVAGGFDKIYSTMKVVKRRLPSEKAPAADAAPETFSGSFADQLEQEVISREVGRGFARATADSRRQRPTVVTGHSLGSALATLFVMENDKKRKFDISTLCTFASPRVGNMEFVHVFNQLPVNSWRIVNVNDFVPKIPFHIPVLADYGHVDTAYPFDSSKFAKKNLVCSHSMETYLHSLDAGVQLLPECIP
jgi:lipase (class 3)